MSTLGAALQIPTTAPAQSALPVQPAAPNANAATSGDDFVLALTQALASAAPPAATAATLTQVAAPVVAASLEDPTAELPTSDDAAALSLAGMLTLPWMQPTPVALPVQAGGTDADPLELLGVTGAGLPGMTQAAGDATDSTAALTAATTLLDAVPRADAAAPSFDGPMFNPTLDRPAGTTSAAPEAAAAAARPMHTPVGSQAWADELGSRLTMMTERGQQTASLRLSPEHLGPLEIRIAIQDDKASVWFGAAHADTRAAIEHALPRLREMFASQGMSLADAGVSREPPRQQATAPAQQGDGFAEPESEMQVSLSALQRVGLVDAYA